MIRLAFIGVSHWHLRLYVEPVKTFDDVTVVGVSDPDPAAAQRFAANLECKSWNDYRDMCDEVKPDFVIALGRHLDMAAEAEYLIGAGIPFLMEKPCGMNETEVQRIADLAARKDAFAGVAFAWRLSQLVDVIRERLGVDGLRNVLFRRILGTPARYHEWKVDWMLDPAQAGGGCTVNLSVHWLDLFRYLMRGEPVEVTSAVISNAAYQLPVEDYSLIGLRCGRTLGVADTGYLFPAQLDMHYSINADTGYLIVRDPSHAQLVTPSGGVEELEVRSVPNYRGLVRQALDQARTGGRPLADMSDMAAVMHMVGTAYRIAGWPSVQAG